MRNYTMEQKSDELRISKEKLSAFYRYDKQRDSGYLTDNSPAFSNQLQFNFDEDSVNERNTVPQSNFQLFDTDEVSDDCFEEEDIAENTDKEVACAMSLERDISVPIPINRPSAPAPPMIINNDIHDGCISDTEHFTSYSFQRGFRGRNKSHFRPIGRRTISTQTPHHNSQIIQHCVTSLSDRFHPYDAPLGRGTVHNRLRYNSEEHSSLPDVVPSRDRSISLPDVPALREAHEAEVGRELRRISDEFHFSYHSPRQARILIQRHPGSFPGTWRFGGLWESLRQLFTPSPTNNSAPNH